MLSIVSALLRPSLGAVCRVRRLSSPFADVSVPLCFARAFHGGQSQVRLDMTCVCAVIYSSLNLYITQTSNELFHLVYYEVNPGYVSAFLLWQGQMTVQQVTCSH